MKRPVRKVVMWGIGLLGMWGVVIVLLLFLLLVISLGVIISSRDDTLPFSSGAAIEPIPPQLVPIYHAAGAKYHVPWAILAGINRVETDFGRDLSVSSAGAIGWMQFEPATWATYAVDANGDGKIDPYDPVDAIFSAANYLSANDAEKYPFEAVFQYNHSNDYVREVLQLAQTYQAWNPLSVDWAWPVHDTHDAVSAVTDAQHEPLDIKVHSPAGVQVVADHQGTVTSVTGTGVTIDIGYGLTLTEQGLTPTIGLHSRLHVGEDIGLSGTKGIILTVNEEGTALPVLWFLQPIPQKFAQSPVLNLVSSH